MNKVTAIINVMNINSETGVSNWHNIDELEKQLGFPLRGNGSPYFQNDRGLGKYYILEKQRNRGNKLSFVRTTGFAHYHQSHRASNIPYEVRRWLETGLPCAMCGTTHNITADHKDGNKQPINNPNIDDYQPLCQHCNTVKREICKKCIDTLKRFDAKAIGYNISWIEGDNTFKPMYPRCKGCYWYSPRDFRKSLYIKG